VALLLLLQQGAGEWGEAGRHCSATSSSSLECSMAHRHCLCRVLLLLVVVGA
jgi:hypothetical protein